MEEQEALGCVRFIAHNRESGEYTLTDSGRATLTAILEDVGLK
jgi:DNA-binding PadR family transcriptional regulator